MLSEGDFLAFELDCLCADDKVKPLKLFDSYSNDCEVSPNVKENSFTYLLVSCSSYFDLTIIISKEDIARWREDNI